MPYVHDDQLNELIRLGDPMTRVVAGEMKWLNQRLDDVRTALVETDEELTRVTARRGLLAEAEAVLVDQLAKLAKLAE